MKFKYVLTFNNKECNLGPVLLILFSLCLIIGTVILFKTIAGNSSSEQSLCTSEECIQTAADIILAMDTSVDPCDDFYRFTCGRWTVDHRIQQGSPKISGFTIVHQKIIDNVLKFLKSNESVAEPTALRKSRNMFRSCMTPDSGDKKYEPYFQYLKLLGLPEIPRIFNISAVGTTYKFDWMKTDIVMSTLTVPLIACNVQQNKFNSSQNVITCGLPEQILTLNIENKTGIQNYQYMKTAIETLIQDKYDIPHNFDEIFNSTIAIINGIETRILKDIHLTYSYLDCLTNMSIEVLQNNMTNYLNSSQMKTKLVLKEYLGELFRYSNLTLDFNNKDEIQICPEFIGYYRAIADLVSKESDINLELWAWWRTVFNLFLPSSLPAEQACANNVLDTMEYAITYAMTDKSFINMTKLKVQEMLHDIKDAFEIEANSTVWMDDKTKKLTIEKNRAMAALIGYPEWLLNKDELEKYYSSITISSDIYLNNLIEITKFKKMLLLGRLNVVNNNEWPCSPMEVNAFNTIIGNAIAIPFGIINYPFYNNGLEVINYATLGSILGHELTHGFDNTGRKYDKYGNYRQWWNNKTIQDFDKLTECFIDQYDNFYVPEVQTYINGTRTLGENLADNGGLHLAYLAYHKHAQRNGETLKLPGLEHFSNDQLFFISYSNIWCDESTTDELKQFVLKDPHSPSKYRVLGTLMNYQEFAEAFKCPSGSKMNPKSKCKIW